MAASRPVQAKTGATGAGAIIGTMCPHLPACPPADRPDRDAARTGPLIPSKGGACSATA